MPTVPRCGRRRAGAIQCQAGAHPLRAGGQAGMSQHGGGIAGGHRARQSADHLAEVRVGLADAVGFIGAGVVVQVADFADQAARGQLPGLFEGGAIVVRAEAGVMDVSGETQPDRRPLARRRLRQPLQLRGVGDDQVQVRRVQQQGVGGRVQAAIDQHRSVPSELSAGSGFVQVQHGQAVGVAQGRQHARQAVAVGVGFHRGPQPWRVAVRQRGAQAREVVGHGARVDAGMQGRASNPSGR